MTVSVLHRFLILVLVLFLLTVLQLFWMLIFCEFYVSQYPLSLLLFFGVFQ